MFTIVSDTISRSSRLFAAKMSRSWWKWWQILTFLTLSAAGIHLDSVSSLHSLHITQCGLWLACTHHWQSNPTHRSLLLSSQSLSPELGQWGAVCYATACVWQLTGAGPWHRWGAGTIIVRSGTQPSTRRHSQGPLSTKLFSDSRLPLHCLPLVVCVSNQLLVCLSSCVFI